MGKRVALLVLSTLFAGWVEGQSRNESDCSRRPSIWTGTYRIRWGGTQELGPSDLGWISDLSGNVRRINRQNAPAPRYHHTLIWTGKEAIVWGGFDGREALNSGALYSPVTDSWRTMAEVNAPPPRYHHRVKWNGAFLRIAGGTDGLKFFSDEWLYDPRTNGWAELDNVVIDGTQN